MLISFPIWLEVLMLVYMVFWLGTGHKKKYGIRDEVIRWDHFQCYWPFVWGIPLTKASDVVLWCSLWSAPEQMVKETIKALVIWDAITLMMTSL